MNLQELKASVWERVDDAPSDITVIKWFDDAQNRLASACDAKFPRFVSNNQFDPNYTPVWDEKWHEALIVFACARYKESEASISEVNNFQTQFEEIKREMSENYQVPPQYRDDRVSQQFTATAGQTTFTITKLGYDPVYGNLKVYVNGIPTTDYLTPADGSPSFTFNPTTVLNVDDKVTVLWEEHYEYQQAPYGWWSF